MTRGGGGLLASLLVALAVASAIACVDAPRTGAANALLVVAVAAVCLAAPTRWIGRGAPRDLPSPRGRALRLLLPAVVAAVATAPALGLPFLADDWVLLDRSEAAASPIAAMLPQSDELFLRPVVWALWWVLARVDPGSGALAHGLAVALFSATAALLVPALRRLGLPKGIALASACVFASSPVGLESTAWTANLYSLVSGLLAVASIAVLPVRWRGTRSLAWPSLLAVGSVLSKEDTILLPALLVLAGARWRLASVPRWTIRLLPLLAVFGGAVALRLLVYGDVGGYRDAATGKPLFVDFFAENALLSLKRELPATFLLPLRQFGTEAERTWILSTLMLVPILLVALGGASPASRRGLPRAAAWVALAFLPIIGVLPVGNELASGRLLHFPSIGLSLAAASCLAGAPLGRRGRWLGVSALVLVGLLVGRRNFEAWERAGEAVRRGGAAAAARVAEAPRGSTCFFLGLPDSVRGAFAFRNATEPMLRRLARRPDVEIPRADRALGRLDAIYRWEGAEQPLLDPSLDGVRPIESGETLLWTGRAAGTGEGEIAVCDAVASSEARDPRLFWTPGSIGSLVLPPLRVAAGTALALAIDGAVETWSGVPEPFAVALSRFRDGAWERVLVPPAQVEGGADEPGEERIVLLEIVVPPGRTLSLRSVRVTAR